MILHSRVTVFRPAPKDRYGNPTGPDATFGPYKAEFQPLSTTETVGDRASVTTRYRVTLPPVLPGITGLGATDKLTIHGLVYGIEGDLEPWTVDGRLHHHECTVRRTTG